ncbi:hypothetical protein [Brevibacillus centrosporus]|nr:hypothetical protein [Brevibacillus centrosporus]
MEPKFVFNYSLIEFPDSLLPFKDEMGEKMAEACSKIHAEYLQKAQ